MISAEENNCLSRKAKNLRKKTLDLSLEYGGFHLGGAFSEIELLVSLFDKKGLKPEDKFIMSKGHASYPLYILLKEKGLNPKISVHPDLDEENGIYATTGSLGHGLPIAAGMAFARKVKKQKGNIYVLVGDGECEEGTFWETMALAVEHNLYNLTTIIDDNKLRALDRSSSHNLKSILNSMGTNTLEIDGHSFPEIFQALNKRDYDKTNVILANTIKGKGADFIESDPRWHARIPTKRELERLYLELK